MIKTNLAEWNKKTSGKDREKFRIIILEIFFTFMFLILLKHLWKLQVVDGEKYAENFKLKTTKTIVEKGARGNIYDCNGNILAANKLVYTITLVDNGQYKTSREKQLFFNSLIYRLRKKLYQNGESFQNELKIAINSNGEYEYTVDGMALQRFKADIFGKRNPDEMTEEESAISASDLIKYLSENDKFGLYGAGEEEYSADELKEYGLPGEYTKEEILDIVGIRYMLSLYSYRKYQAVTIARDISSETMAYVLENKDSFTGIEVEEDWERVYEGGEAFAHILGYVGNISSEELEAADKENSEYFIDSVTGKSGIEQYFESYLQGINGEKTVVVDNVGRIVEDKEIVIEPAAGNDIYLSIDRDLQTAVYQILEQTLAGIVSSNLIDAKYFDKTKIRDSSEIRIPVFDVYIALIDNNIVSIENMKLENASDFEKQVAEKIYRKKDMVKSQLLSEFTDTPHSYEALSEEMQEYVSFVVRDSGLIDKEKTDEEDPAYIAWKRRKYQRKRFFISKFAKRMD